MKLFKKTILFILISLAFQSMAYARITYSLHLQNVDSGIASQISNAIAEAVNIYNDNGSFDKHLNIYYDAGQRTAYADYGGKLTFGGSRNTRVALHEISHTLGIGTTSAYWDLMSGGKWSGFTANAAVSDFDGANSTMKGDRLHIWPYGLNYDSEDSSTARERHVAIVQAMRCDMGLGPCIEGVNRTIINRASSKVLDAKGNSNGANVIIYSDYGTQNQRWTITYLGNNEYSIRSRQEGNRAMDTWNGGTSNGTNMALYDYWGGSTQRYYIEKVESGWYSIKPVIANNQCVDAYGTGNAANVGTWSCWGGQNQQWRIR